MSTEIPSQEVETSNFKCPSCGASMAYDAELQKLSCEHCGATCDVDSFVVEEQDILKGLSCGEQWEEDFVSVFACENCGAKVVLEKSETAKSCPFCGTAHVKKTDELVGLKPNGVIPFSFGDDKALEYSKIWAKKRFFAPSKFKKHLSAENIKGLYAPCFTFDSNTFSRYEGRIGQTRTRTVGSGKNMRTETYTVWRNISGTYSCRFDDLLFSAGEKLSQSKLDKISPFDTNNGKKYEEKYLLGYGAYHYDTELSDCWQMAKDKMDGVLKRKILSQYSYDKVAYFNVSTRHTDVTYKYVMLPVYVGNFSFKKKLYNFYVNGSTGKTFGKYPKSVLKILGVVLLGVALVVGIGLLLSHAGVF